MGKKYFFIPNLQTNLTPRPLILSLSKGLSGLLGMGLQYGLGFISIKKFVFCAVLCSTTISTAYKMPWVIIYIHGTMGLSDVVSLSDLPTLFHTNIQGSSYEQKMRLARFNTEPYSLQPTQELGLRPIALTNCPTSAAELFGKLYRNLHRTFFPNEGIVGMYTFGWSGMLNHQERYEAGRKLFTDLCLLHQSLSGHYKKLKIRIVAFSHGANVVWNMGAASAYRTAKPFSLEEVILLGGPVQYETECCLNAPLFKNTKIYHIQSRADYIVRSDCFSSKRFLPKRFFSNSARQPLPKNIKQIELKITIPGEHNPLKPHRSRKRIDRSPGHSEFWNFGSKDSTYHRTYAPLYPIPIALMTPAIIKTINKSKLENNALIFELQPDKGVARIRARNAHKRKTVYCISPYLLALIRTEASDFLHQGNALDA